MCSCRHNKSCGLTDWFSNGLTDLAHFDITLPTRTNTYGHAKLFYINNTTLLLMPFRWANTLQGRFTLLTVNCHIVSDNWKHPFARSRLLQRLQFSWILHQLILFYSWLLKAANKVAHIMSSIPISYMLWDMRSVLPMIFLKAACIYIVVGSMWLKTAFGAWCL